MTLSEYEAQKALGSLTQEMVEDVIVDNSTPAETLKAILNDCYDPITGQWGPWTCLTGLQANLALIHREDK